MIRFDSLPPLVMGAVTSFSLLRLLDVPFLYGQAKTGSFCTGPPSSGGFVALVSYSVGTRKIGEDGVVVLRNTEVLRADN